MMYIPIHFYSPSQQLSMLRGKYKEGTFRSLSNSSWEWLYSLQPREMSPSYKIKIVYKKYFFKVFVLDKLRLADNQNKLPHVYDNEKQQICLYYSSREWNASKSITIVVPWISEWLYFYEIWLITGEWCVGGIHRE